MNAHKIILTCCGQTIPAGGMEPVNCPACSTHFDEADIEQLQAEQVTKLPVVDVLRATSMLAHPADWINKMREERRLEPVHYAFLGMPFVFEITSVRRLADELNLPIMPLPIRKNGVLGAVLWVKR